jgi:cell division protein FtsB
VGLVVVAAGLAVYGGTGAVRVWQMQREIEAVERDLATLRARTAELARQVDRLRNDPLFIEKLAREELGLVREGETVLKFPSRPFR